MVGRLCQPRAPPLRGYRIWLTLALAKRRAEEQNFLGLEIREKLVERANAWAEELGLKNIRFLCASANSSLPGLLESYAGPLSMVCILCPDPHFKNRHHKRRVVQGSLVLSIARHLAPGGQVFVESDVEAVARQMRDELEGASEAGGEGLLAPAPEHRDPSKADAEGWLLASPLGVHSERETVVLQQGLPMYRRLYVRK